jgi:hypothetical protein
MAETLDRVEVILVPQLETPQVEPQVLTQDQVLAEVAGLAVQVVLAVQVLSLFDTYNQLPALHPSSSMALGII